MLTSVPLPVTLVVRVMSVVLSGLLMLRVLSNSPCSNARCVGSFHDSPLRAIRYPCSRSRANRRLWPICTPL